MTGNDFPETVKKHLRNRSLDAWEWYGEEREIFQIRANQDKTLTQRQGNRSGSALRIVHGRRTGTALTAGQDESAIIACADRAEKCMMNSSETDERPVFSSGFDVPGCREYFDPAVDDPDRHRKRLQSDEIWKYHRMEGLNLVEGIVQEERVHRFIITSNGADLRSSETLFTSSGKWYVAHSRKLLFEDHASSRFEQALQPSWHDSLSVLAQHGSACSLPPGNYNKIDLIFSPEAGRHWLSVLFQSYLNGSRVFESFSGTARSNNGLVVADDRTLRTAPGSVTFDGEGYPAQKVILFSDSDKDQGTCYSETPMKTGKNPTGYADRDEWLRPFTAPGNLFIRNGTENFESLIQPVIRGIWVYKLFGVAGECESRGIVLGFEGLWILDGRISAPCSGMTHTMPLREWIENIAGIGNDLRINQRVSSTTLKFSGITVAVC